MPIYFVIVEQIRQPNLFLAVWHIIEVISTTLDRVDALYAQKVAPLLQSGRIIQAHYYYREPDNPFNAWKEGK